VSGHESPRVRYADYGHAAAPAHLAVQHRRRSVQRVPDAPRIVSGNVHKPRPGGQNVAGDARIRDQGVLPRLPPLSSRGPSTWVTSTPRARRASVHDSRAGLPRPQRYLRLAGRLRFREFRPAFHNTSSCTNVASWIGVRVGGSYEVGCSEECFFRQQTDGSIAGT
jgi:hypothetical protein